MSAEAAARFFRGGSYKYEYDAYSYAGRAISGSAEEDADALALVVVAAAAAAAAGELSDRRKDGRHEASARSGSVTLCASASLGPPPSDESAQLSADRRSRFGRRGFRFGELNACTHRTEYCE